MAGGSNKVIEGGDDDDKGIENGEQGEQGGYSGSARNGGYRGGELGNCGGPHTYSVPGGNAGGLWSLGCAIKASLWEDRKQQSEEAGA